MENKHTPTPWIVYGRDVDTNKIEICQSGITNIAKRLRIAEVLPQPHYADNQEANARLIVRAVNEYDALKATNAELLEALKDLVSRFPEGPYEGAFSANARRMIAKAEKGDR